MACEGEFGVLWIGELCTDCGWVGGLIGIEGGPEDDKTLFDSSKELFRDEFEECLEF